jgi:hypothetical protein
VISLIKASLHHLVERKLEEILVVWEFPNVFLEYLLGMPPERAIEFKIQLQPGIAHIAKSSYRMMPLELAEPKLQLKDLLGKGYIHLSSSPWGCQSFFMKKKGEALHLCVDYLLSHPEIMNLGKIWTFYLNCEVQTNIFAFMLACIIFVLLSELVLESV